MATSLDIDLAEWEAKTKKAEAEIVKAEAQKMELQDRRRNDRYEFFGAVLIGLAIVLVILAIVGGIWSHNDRQGDRTVERERAKVETVEACLTLPEPAERQLCVALLDAKVADSE